MRSVIVFVLLLVGCGKASDPTIVGAWYRYVDADSTKIERLIFSGDGFMQSSVYKKDGSYLTEGTNTKITQQYFTFTLDGVTLTTVYQWSSGNTLTNVSTIKQLTSDTLEFTDGANYSRASLGDLPKGD